MKNLYIVADGLGGAGKGTVLGNLEKNFGQRGYRVITTYEPGGTPEADRLRAELFERKKSGTVTPVEELDYVFAARAINMRVVVLPALASPELTVVLKDRDYLSSFIYQVASGASRDLLMDYYKREYEGVGFPRPDLRLLLLLSTKEAMRRRYGAGFNGDGFDMQPYEYWQSVAMGYYNEATDIARSQGIFQRETVVIDAMRPVEVVCEGAWRAVERLGLEDVEGRETKGWYK
jgi:dTMP kinase